MSWRARCLLFVASALAPLVWAQSAGEIVLDLAPSVGNPRNEPGGFATLKSGRVVCYFGRSDHRWSAEGAIKMAEIHSDDAGRTWSEPRLALDDGGGTQTFCVSVLRLKSGKLLLIYVRKRSELEVTVCFRLSRDDGRTWSQERQISGAIDDVECRNDCAIETEFGRIIVALSTYRMVGRENNYAKSIDPRGISLWVYSDDDGRVWMESPAWWTLPALTPDGQDERAGLQEPGVVELADHSFLSWARTARGSQYFCRSHSRGTYWPLIFTVPEPSGLASPLSPASIKRLPGSNLLLAVYNDHSGKFPGPPADATAEAQWTPLAAAVSFDNGRTWPRRWLLEADVDEIFSHPAIHFLEDSALIAYAAQNRQYPQHLGRLRIRRVSLTWLTGPDPAAQR